MYIHIFLFKYVQIFGTTCYTCRGKSSSCNNNRVFIFIKQPRKLLRNHSFSIVNIIKSPKFLNGMSFGFPGKHFSCMSKIMKIKKDQIYLLFYSSYIYIYTQILIDWHIVYRKVRIIEIYSDFLIHRILQVTLIVNTWYVWQLYFLF